MEEEMTVGKLDSVEMTEGKKERTLKDGTTSKTYIKLKVNGQTYNFFDYDFYAEHIDVFKIGNNVQVVWFPSEWTDSSGQKITSRVAKAVTFASKEQVQSQVDQAFQRASELKNNIDGDMIHAWETAHSIAQRLKEKDISLSADDIRSTAMSIFIEGNKRR